MENNKYDNRYLDKLHTDILKIMDEVDRVCKEYHHNYYLMCGSCLGAIRHNGFIPWDDDLDIAMPRNVQVQSDKVCVMSKNLTEFIGNYASVTKLDAVSSRFVLEQLNQMVNDGMYNLFFEDALVQMIFDKNFELYYKDIKDYQWTEVDNVDDLLVAKKIHMG